MNRTFCRFSPVSSGTNSRWWCKKRAATFLFPCIFSHAACTRTGPTDATKTFSCFYPARTPYYYRGFAQPWTIDRLYLILSIHDARQIPVQHASRAAILCRVSETSLRSLFFFSLPHALRPFLQSHRVSNLTIFPVLLLLIHFLDATIVAHEHTCVADTTPPLCIEGISSES